MCAILRVLHSAARALRGALACPQDADEAAAAVSLIQLLSCFAFHDRFDEAASSYASGAAPGLGQALGRLEEASNSVIGGMAGQLRDRLMAIEGD